MKEDKTIEDRAKEYLAQCGYVLDKDTISGIVDFHKQELSNALPSDEEVEKEFFGRNFHRGLRIEGAKWLKQQILDKIK